MNCPACGEDNLAGRRFCRACGALLEISCPSCGAANEPDDWFCGLCGAQLGDSPASQRSVSPPAHLAARVLASRSALEGERKQVTVLFADVKGSLELLADRDPEEARGILEPVLQHMIAAVHRYEGTVNQVMGDGIMALFGAPVAHEDHAVRACYAALAMQEAIKVHTTDVARPNGTPVQIRVGLNSGEVVVGAIGSDLRMEYTAVGQSTHLAARMEQTATPGSIFLTAATLALAEGYVHVAPVGPVAVKGLADPVEVSELTGASLARTRLQVAAARGLTRFVGRDDQLATLERRLDLAGAGQGQVVAVVGQPGVGKSRLLWEFTRSSHTEGWLVLETNCVSYGRANPYQPLMQLLKTYFAIEPHDDLRSAQDKVIASVRALDAALRPALAPIFSLLGIEFEDSTWDSADPERRRQLTLQSACDLLIRESQRRPVLVVLEDLQEIDTETQAFLDSLVEGMADARLFLLFNYRPEYVHTWARHSYYTPVGLDPLAPAGAEELLASLLGPNSGFGPSQERLLIERTQGNPFFIEESVRDLVERGVLAGERGAYRLKRPIEAALVPATVQAMLAGRIDRLPEPVKASLQLAAVIGNAAPYWLLQAIADQPEARLRASLNHLGQAEFLYETSLYPEEEFTFKHALTQEVAYGGLLLERRRSVHGRIVAAIEDRYRDEPEEHLEQLAHHAFRSQVWAKASDYSEQAAQRALGLYAFGEAAGWIEQALEAQTALDPADVAKRCGLQLALGEALVPAGKMLRAAEEVAPEAFALAEALGDKRSAFRASLLGIQALRLHARYEAHGLPAFQQWAERADQYAALDTSERAWADMALAYVSLGRGDVDNAWVLADRAMHCAEETGDSEALYDAAGVVVQSYGGPELEEDRLRVVQALVHRPRGAVTPKTLHAFLVFAGRVLLGWGKRKDAEQAWGELNALAAESHDQAIINSSIGAASWLAVVDGELEKAVELARGALSRVEDPNRLASARRIVADRALRPLIYLGRAEEALAQVLDAERLGSQGGGISRLQQALCLTHLGQQAEARSALVELIAATEGSTSLVWLLEIAVLLGERDFAAMLQPRLVPIASFLPGNTCGLVCTARHLGAASALLGKLDEAHAWYQRALEVCEQARFRPEIALTRLGLAELLLEHYPDDRAEAADHLDFAIKEFETMKMAPSLERALHLTEQA